MKNQNKEDFEPLKKFLKEYKSCFSSEIIYPEDSKKLEANLIVKEKEGMYLYNYNTNIVLVPRNHPILKICRGLVLSTNGDCLCYPFNRFFNHFEKEADKIDWKNSLIQEKLDGSLINVFWNKNKRYWEITTRGSFYPTIGDTDFSIIFKRIFNKFDILNKDVCYMFKLISRENRIVKLYTQEFIVLLGARNLKNLIEFNQKELDIFSDRENINRPKKYGIGEYDYILNLFKTFNQDDEGVVVIDTKNNNRIKIKQESYIKLARIMQLNDEAIFDYAMGRNDLDVEILNSCEDVKKKIEEMQKASSILESKINVIGKQIK